MWSVYEIFRVDPPHFVMAGDFLTQDFSSEVQKNKKNQVQR